MLTALTTVLSMSIMSIGDTIAQYIGFALLLSLVLLALLAVVAFFAFGGVRRNGPAQFALGVFTLVTGTAFLAVMQASMRARMDNAYLLNGFIGMWFLLVAVILLFGALVGYGVPWWVAVPLMVGGIGVEWYAIRQMSANAPDGGEPIILGSALVLGLAVVIVLARGHWRSLTQSVVLGVLAALGVLIPYLFGHPGVSFWLLVDDLDKPQYTVPFVDTKEVILCLIFGVVVFVVARRLDQGGARLRHAPTQTARQ